MQQARLEKIARLVQKELSEIFRLETAKIGNILVSVSSVRVSPDLSIARVYLSVFPSDKAQEIITNVNTNEKGIRYALAQKVRYQLRKCPELSFYLDDSLDYIDHIDSLLHKHYDKSDSDSSSDNNNSPEQPKQ
jgi:ribosome-binding factor A